MERNDNKNDKFRGGLAPTTTFFDIFSFSPQLECPGYFCTEVCCVSAYVFLGLQEWFLCR